MIPTCSSEVREYSENLMKPLVTNEKLEELKSFQDKIVEISEHKLKEQNTKIEELASKLAVKLLQITVS